MRFLPLATLGDSLRIDRRPRAQQSHGRILNSSCCFLSFISQILRTCATGWRSTKQQRRTGLDIDAAILSALAFDNLSINKIVFHLNLNRKRAKNRVEALFYSGFLQVHNHARFDSYSITQKGIDWLSRYKRLMQEMKYQTNRPG